jgi:hypothetical protein
VCGDIYSLKSSPFAVHEGLELETDQSLKIRSCNRSSFRSFWLTSLRGPILHNHQYQATIKAREFESWAELEAHLVRRTRIARRWVR